MMWTFVTINQTLRPQTPSLVLIYTTGSTQYRLYKLCKLRCQNIRWQIIGPHADLLDLRFGLTFF